MASRPGKNRTAVERFVGVQGHLSEGNGCARMMSSKSSAFRKEGDLVVSVKGKPEV